MGDQNSDLEIGSEPMAMAAAASAVGGGGGDVYGYNSSSMSRSAGITELVLRLSAAVLTVISLSLIASDPNFSYVPAFNYLLAATTLSFLYSVAQSVIAGYHLVSSGQSLLPIAFHTYSSIGADLFCSILLLSGSSAAFGVTTNGNYTNNFIAQANGSASMAFIAFLFMLASTALSGQRLSTIIRGK